MKNKKPISLLIFLLAFSLVVLALTIASFPLILRLYGRFLMPVFLRTFFPYWPETTLRIILNPGVIWADPRLFQFAIVYSKFPYVHLVTHTVTTGLTILYASSLRRSRWVWGILSLFFPFLAPFILVFLKPKSAEGTANLGVCENCGHQREKGKHYGFHYGKLISSKSGIDLPYLTTRNTYTISGTDGAWICQTCTVQRFFARVIFPILLLPGLHFGMDFEADGLFGVLFGLFGFAGLAGFLVLLFRGRSMQVLGEDMAIKIKTPKLQRAGYDSFFNHKQHSRLTRSQ